MPRSDPDFWEQVERARRMTGEEKIREGFRLFEVECQQVRDKFQALHPGLDDDHILAMSRAYFDEQRERDRVGVWIKLPVPPELQHLVNPAPSLR